jgi:hypothetical protein
MTMTPETKATLRQLEDADWFSLVGQHDANTNVAIVLSSWDEAIEHCSSMEWENLELQIVNRLCEKLLAAAPDRFNQWNEIVNEMKQHTIPLVERKIAAVVEQCHLPKVFSDSVQWDILNLCMESEYIDVVPPGFYAGMAFWYVNGHFPCGWKDEPPKGKPIIY